MEATSTQVNGPQQANKHLPLGITVKASTLHRVAHVAAGVVLVTAGILVAVNFSPEVGAGMIASGVHQFVVAMLGEKSGESESEALVHATGFVRHAAEETTKRRPALALDL